MTEKDIAEPGSGGIRLGETSSASHLASLERFAKAGEATQDKAAAHGPSFAVGFGEPVGRSWCGCRLEKGGHCVERLFARFSLWGAIASIVGIPLTIFLYCTSRNPGQDTAIQPEVLIEERLVEGRSGEGPAAPAHAVKLGSPTRSRYPIPTAELERQETATAPTTKMSRYEYKPAVFIGNSLYRRSFRIEILKAERLNDSKLKLHMLVTSQVKGVTIMGLVDPESKAYLVDPEGVRYFFVDQENLTGQFPAGVDIRGSVTFLAPPSSAKRISIVFHYRVGGGYPEDVIFKNLDLELMKLVGPII